MKKRRNFPYRQPLAKNHLLVSNVDALLDTFFGPPDFSQLSSASIEYFQKQTFNPINLCLALCGICSTKEPELPSDPGLEKWREGIRMHMKNAFPRWLYLCRKKNFGSRMYSHFSYRMGSAWHPEAGSCVYAYSYKWKPIKKNPSEEEWYDYQKTFRSISRGRGHTDYFGSLDLIKIGVSLDPDQRQPMLLGELNKILSKERLDKDLGKFEYNRRVALFPCKRSGGGEYLEDGVLSSMPDEDNFYGEWFHDSLHVFGTLLRWFFFAHMMSSTK